MTTTSIEPGLKGTLSPEEYTTKPIPSWGPTYPGMAAAYRNMDYVCVAFATDPEIAYLSSCISAYSFHPPTLRESGTFLLDHELRGEITLTAE